MKLAIILLCVSLQNKDFPGVDFSEAEEEFSSDYVMTTILHNEGHWLTAVSNTSRGEIKTNLNAN